MLFPAFSKLDAKKDKETLRNVFQYSVKYASLLVVPVTALVMCLSEPAVSTLFSNTYALAPLFLALLCHLLHLHGLRKPQHGQPHKRPRTNHLHPLPDNSNAAIGFPLGYVLIMNFGVIGLIITA